MNIVGLDLSLAKTGVAGDHWHRVVASKATGGSYRARGERIYRLAAAVAAAALDADLVVIEGPSYGHGSESGTWDRAGLWWQVTLTLQMADIPYAVVAPAALKQYVTGKGNAGKADVIREITRRFDWFAGDDNEADAVGLAAMGYAWTGRPLVDMPARHVLALGKVEWPTLPIRR